MKKATSTLLGLGLLLAIGACVEQSQELTSAEREELRQWVVTGDPSPQHRLDARLEDRVTLVGYDIDADHVAPGGTFTVTWYWKVNRSLGDGWNVFTHLVDGDHAPRTNQDGTGWVRQHYSPSRWKAGDVIKDQQEINLPGDWPEGSVTAYVGLWNGPARLRVLSGPTDGDNRVRGFTLPVGASAPPAPPSGAAPGVAPAPPTPPAPAAALPNLSVPKAAGAIVVDGRFDEPAWVSAARTGVFVNTMTGAPAELGASARVTWDEQNLYFAFDVADDYLKSTFTQHDDHLWDQDAVEVMLDPAGDARNYFELQVSPTGQVFDTRYDTPRQPQPFGDLGWDSHLRARATVRGTVNDDGDDQGYSVEMAIPWAALHIGNPPTTNPTEGTTWAMNLYVMDARKTGPQRAAAWSAPRVGDFHTLGRFGRITFVGVQGAAGGGGAAVPPVAVVVPPAGGGGAVGIAPPPNGVAPHALSPEQLRGSVRVQGVDTHGAMQVAPPHHE